MARAITRALNRNDLLDRPLLRLSANDDFTARAACEHVLVTGSPGSGKTSGPARALRRAIMSCHGAGLLNLIYKSEDVAACLEDARITGRLQSVIRVDGRHGFNFIRHELSRHGLAGINTVIEFLLRVLEIVRLAMPNGGRTGDAFWENSARQLLHGSVPMLYAAYDTVQVAAIIRFIVSAPTSNDEFESEAWRVQSFWYATFSKAFSDPIHSIDKADLDRIVTYWRDEFARFDPKLRMNITSTVSTALDRFTHGRLAKLFCGETTFVPELTLCGAIIILDLAVSELNEDGVIAQQIIKYAWQRVVLSRNALPPPFRDRLVCCFVDEAQAFLNSYDREFLSLSRSSRSATVFLTQSIPSIITTIGGDNPKYAADALLAQFSTKIFCSNSDPETNRFAAETIGRTIQRRGSYNEGQNSGWSSGVNMGDGSNSGSNSGTSLSPDGKGGLNFSSNWGASSGYSENRGRNRGSSHGTSSSSGFSEAMDYEIEPAEFSRGLKTGGPSNRGIVTAVWFQAGRSFSATGRNWLVASFQQ